MTLIYLPLLVLLIHFKDIIASLREQPAIIKKRHRKSEASSVESNAGFGSSNFARGTTVEIESEDEESTDKQ